MPPIDSSPLTPSPSPPSQEPQRTTCEYTPCKTGPNKDPRKVISHIFGRNKTLTKRIPDHIWVHYCRQHYQRARYRARDWPIRQCELLLVSLRRMESWGFVKGFKVVLRKREGIRVRVERKDENGHGRVVTRSAARGISSYSESTSDKGSVGSSTAEFIGFSPVSQLKNKKRGAASKQPRRKPTILPSPVPEWLRDEASVTQVRTFMEVIAIVNKLKADFESQRNGDGEPRENGERLVARFPDIEILPVFVESVAAGGRGRQRGVRKGKGGS